jgi:two-component system sensor histidine kinase VicK
MRWWLALAFATIAALTALAVAQVFSHRAEHALRDRGEELAIGQTVSAAQAVDQALRRSLIKDAAKPIADRRRFSIYVFAADGRAVTPTVSRGIAFSSVPNGREALEAALHGHRFVTTIEDGKAFVVGLRLPGPGAAALISYTRRPELRSELGIVRDEIVNAALVAVAIGALVGLLVATLIAARLRRIARAAATIEAGAFDQPLRPRFRDELGSLAATFDQMRERLRASFAELGSERDRLRRLLEGLHEGVVAVDESLHVSFANSAARRLVPSLLLDEGSELGEPWPDFPLREFARGLFAGGSETVQSKIVDGDRSYTVTGIPSRRRGGDAVLVLADVSVRERRERAEREFVANAAHELGTPLTAIAASLEVLQGGAKDIPDERDRFLGIVERQTSRLARLRRALLTLARAQTRQEAIVLEPVELRPLLEAVANELGDAVAVDCPAGLHALGQSDLLEQVVYNLAENALKHGSESVLLQAEPVGEDAVGIAVADEGPGIEPAERERLFDRFYRPDPLDQSGFGLGLAIVRESVRAIGGSIELDSEVGRGTVARVRLSAAGARNPADPTRRSA